MNCKTCWTGTACSARCFRAASPQRGSWHQPAQGKCSFPCDDWQKPERCGQSSAFRRAHDVRWTSVLRRPERKRRRPRQGATHYLQVVYSCALSEFWDRAHYPRYSTIRGNFQIVAIYKDFKEISSDNLSLHDTVKVTKENRRL